MTTSIDPSIDELLLLEGNQYHMPNVIFNKIKPIGAERKSMMTVAGMRVDLNTKDRGDESNHQFNSYDITSSTKSTLMSVYDDQLDSGTCPSFSHYSSNSASSTSASSTVPSTQSVSHLLDHSIYQRQISTSFHQHQSISTTITTGKMRPSIGTTQHYSINRFYAPQQYTRNSFSIPSSFAVPSQCTRERFQVNSIGRPIFRSNTYYHHHLKIRR